MPQDNCTLLVDVEICTLRGPGQDDERKTGPRLVHFLKKGISRDVGKLQINQHCGPLIRALVEGEKAGKAVRRVGHFVTVAFQKLANRACDFGIILDVENMTFGMSRNDLCSGV